MKATSLRALRIVGVIEGVSFLILLGVAMPLKYLWGAPEAVKYTGWAHGVLFVGFCACLFMAKLRAKWTAGQALPYFIASLLPLGPFFMDGKLKRQIEELEQASS
jgi:integral membrane protein